MTRSRLANACIGLGAAGLVVCGVTLALHTRGLSVARAEQQRRFDERSAVAGRMVRVGGFFIDETEVSTKSFRACVDAGACSAPSRGEHCNFERTDREDHPINCVDRAQAAAYCAWAGRRLPAASEWESAACPGSKYPWAGDDVAGRDCFDRDTQWESRGAGQFLVAKAQGTCPVGAHPRGAAASGALGMAGNVAEWTNSEERIGGVRSNRWVVHGASWATPSARRQVECPSRALRAPEYRDALLGFRCARNAEPSLAHEMVESLAQGT